MASASAASALAEASAEAKAERGAKPAWGAREELCRVAHARSASGISSTNNAWLDKFSVLRRR